MRKAHVDPRVDAVYTAIRGRIDWDNLVPVCIEAAREIQQFTTLRGPQKLDVLQSVLKQALRDSDKTDLEKEQILHYIDTVVPIVAQAAKLASKLPIVTQAVTTCWKKCRS